MDEKLDAWTNLDAMRAASIMPDEGAHYDGGVHIIDLSQIKPMVAHPGNPDEGIPSDPTNGALIADIGSVDIDIAYGGSCTAGKIDDIAYYAMVCQAAEKSGLKIKENVDFYIQYGSGIVKDMAVTKGWHDLFNESWSEINRPWLWSLYWCWPRSFINARSNHCFSNKQKFPRSLWTRQIIPSKPSNGSCFCFHR